MSYQFTDDNNDAADDDGCSLGEKSDWKCKAQQHSGTAIEEISRGLSSS